MSPEANPLDLGEDYRKVLNHHGYGFQYSVIELMNNLQRERRSDWKFEAAEFPVIVQGRSTRIDFVFRKTQPLAYLVAECKRANPALSNWCFSSSDYARGGSAVNKIVYQCAWVEPPDKRLAEVLSRTEARRMLTGAIPAHVQRAYHVGRSVRSNQPGDKSGRDNDAIEKAAGQVCTGLNGLIEYFNSQRLKLPENEKLFFLPVIFTTARIWTTDVDLASAGIEKGEFEHGSVPVKEALWIWYQYHLSPELKHAVANDETVHVSPFDLQEALEREFMQSIAIVSVKGIEDFLRSGFSYR